MATMSAAPETSASQPVDLDIAAGQAIAACGGDAREAVKELLVAKRFVGFNFSGRTGYGACRRSSRSCRSAPRLAARRS
jgi:hypothetical protein